jgi:hypothetical protein
MICLSLRLRAIGWFIDGYQNVSFLCSIKSKSNPSVVVTVIVVVVGFPMSCAALAVYIGGGV